MGDKMRKEPKTKISISLPKYLKNKIDHLIEKGEFSSVSEVITIATTEFLVKFEKKKEEKILGIRKSYSEK